MRHIKSALAIILALLMIFAAMPITAMASIEDYEEAEIIDSGECGLYVDWKLSSLGTLFLEKNGSNAATYDYPVDKNSPFRNDSRIKKIIVGEGVTYLGRMVFRDIPNLTEVVIEDGLKEMEFGVFSGCPLLTELELPASFNRFTTVSPFYGSSIKKLTFKGNELTTNTEAGYAWDREFSNADIYIPMPFTMNGTVLNTYEEAAEAFNHNNNQVHCVNSNATIKWKNYDGTMLETDENATQGAIPTYDGETPTKPSDNTNSYYFKGWEPEPFEVTGDMTYTAMYGSFGKSSYIDENGEEQEVFARPLTGTETELPGGWYVANQDITYANNLEFTGDTNLILADGATLNVENQYTFGTTENGNLNIYCQKNKSGVLTTNYLGGSNINIYGGNINNPNFMMADYNINVFDGNINAGYIWSVKSGSINILGGTTYVEYNIATGGGITFGYKNPTDSIYINNFSGSNTDINIVEGQSLANEADLSQTYSGTAIGADLKEKKLVPYAKNPITYVSGGHGTVKGVRTSQTSAYPQETVSFTVQPDQYYAIDTLTVKDAFGNDIEVTYKESRPNSSVIFRDYVFDMPITPVTVTATFKSSAHEVSYLDENGNEKTATAYTLDDKYTSYDGGWYVADKELCFPEKVTFTGDAHIILSDSATVNVGNNDSVSSADDSGSVNIYWQSEKTGTLNASIYAGTVNIYGGNISSTGIGGTQQANIYDGQINTNNILVLDGSAAIYGGNVTVAYSIGASNITLGCSRSEDSIYAKSYVSSNPVNIMDGQTLGDGLTSYTETAATSDIANKTLRPALLRSITYGASQNGTVSGSRAATYKNKVTPVVTPNAGYELDTLTVKDAYENEISVTDGRFTMPNSEVTVTASFKQKKYTVKWIVNGEQVETDENLTYGMTPEFGGEAPANYYKDGKHYVFCGWNDGANTYTYDELPNVTADVSYTAAYAQTEHNYGEPVWNWSEDYTSATVEFTCNEQLCKHKESVSASVETEATDAKIIYTATVQFNGKTYKDTVEVDNPCKDSYNLTLEDGVKVNFYIDIPYYNAVGGHIEYSYLVSTDDKNAERKTYVANDDSEEFKAQENGTRKLTLKAAPAQIAEKYIIKIYDSNEELKDTVTASIQDYCNVLINSDFAQKDKDVAQALLNYGALADEYFGYAEISKAATGEEYSVAHSEDYKDAVDAESFKSKAKASVVPGVDQSGAALNITGISYVALLDPELRFYVNQTNDVWCYYTDLSISDPSLTAEWIKTDKGNCVRVTGLKASDFAKTFTLTIGTTEVTYNGYVYLYTVLREGSTVDNNLKNLAKGIYRYAAACEAKFA